MASDTFKKFVELSKNFKPTELQVLEYKRGRLVRYIERLKNVKYPHTPGVYGTVASDASQDSYYIECIRKDIEKLDKQIENLKNQLQTAEK